MSTNREYVVSVSGKPEDNVTGSYSVSAWDAAKNYAGIYLPGFKVVSCKYVKTQDTEKHGLHTLWKAEAVNQDTQMGEVVWVREL